MIWLFSTPRSSFLWPRIRVCGALLLFRSRWVRRSPGRRTRWVGRGLRSAGRSPAGRFRVSAAASAEGDFRVQQERPGAAVGAADLVGDGADRAALRVQVGGLLGGALEFGAVQVWGSLACHRVTFPCSSWAREGAGWGRSV